MESMVDARREIEELVGFEARWPGTDAERRAAGHLAKRLEDLGREAQIEPTRVLPNYATTHLIHALLAIVGSVLSITAPSAGFALVLVATVSAGLDLTGIAFLIRRLTGARASQNVVSREEGDKPGTLILTAHYDAARTGVIFGRRTSERRAALGKLLHRPIGPFEPFFWSLIALLVCCALRLGGIEGYVLTIVQFIPTVVLIVSAPLFADIALSGVVPGASDNASGVATVLRLAERYGGDLDNFDVWVLFPGAEEGLMLGMREWLKRHRKELDAARTIFLNVDKVGHGTVRYVTKEGFVVAHAYHPTLVDLCDQIAEEDEEEGRYGARPVASRNGTDATAARSRGFPAITISCLNALDYDPTYHQATDTPENIDPEALERAFGFCSELIELIDERVGKDLVAAGEGDATELSEADGR
ncbi:MAG: M28 family metallopeptidase [Thermoleophilaceae bacterium]